MKKANKFSNKMPVLGSNIVIIHETEKRLTICEFNLELRKSILNDSVRYDYLVDFYSDDAEENLCGTCVDSNDKWIYPSQLVDLI